MFENLSKRSIILIAATGVAAIATIASALKDRHDSKVCDCECCECIDEECELADPTAEIEQ